MKEICRECCCWDAGSGGCTVALVGHDDATCVSALSRRVEGLERGIQRMTEEARETKAPTPDLRPGLMRAREMLEERASGLAASASCALLTLLDEESPAATLKSATKLAVRRDELMTAMTDLDAELERLAG